MPPIHGKRPAASIDPAASELTREYAIESREEDPDTNLSFLYIKFPVDILERIDAGYVEMILELETERKGFLLIGDMRLEIEMKKDILKEYYNVVPANETDELTLLGSSSEKVVIGSIVQSFDAAASIVKEKTEIAEREYKKRKTVSITVDEPIQANMAKPTRSAAKIATFRLQNQSSPLKTVVKKAAVSSSSTPVGIGTQKQKAKIDIDTATRWIVLRDISSDVRSDDIQYFFNGIRIDGDGLYATFNESRATCDVFVLFETPQGMFLALDLDNETFKTTKGKVLAKNVRIAHASFLDATLAKATGVNLCGQNQSAADTMQSLANSLPGFTLPGPKDLSKKFFAILCNPSFSLHPDMISSHDKVNAKVSKPFDVFHRLSETCFFSSQNSKYTQSSDTLFAEVATMIRTLQYNLVTTGVDSIFPLKDSSVPAKVFDAKRKYLENALAIYSVIYDRLWLSCLSDK